MNSLTGLLLVLAAFQFLLQIRLFQNGVEGRPSGDKGHKLEVKHLARSRFHDDDESKGVPRGSRIKKNVAAQTNASRMSSRKMNRAGSRSLTWEEYQEFRQAELRNITVKEHKIRQKARVRADIVSLFDSDQEGGLFNLRILDNDYNREDEPVVTAPVPVVRLPQPESSLGVGDDALARARCADYYDRVQTLPFLVADPRQCDRFALCSLGGVKHIHLCDPGHGVDLETGLCGRIGPVDCAGRPARQSDDPGRDGRQLRQPEGTCPRSNGFFAVEERCDLYVECRKSKLTMSRCPVGTVFEARLANCVHPDESSRTSCHHYLSTASSGLPQVLLEPPAPPCPFFLDRARFGNHDRRPHPDSCSLFYVCLPQGVTRIGSCEPPKAFDRYSGRCKYHTRTKDCKGLVKPKKD